MRRRFLVGVFTAFGFLVFPLLCAELKLEVPELPKEPGKSVVFEIPGLAEKAKKLEFVMVPGQGAVKPFLLGKYEVTQGQYETVMGTNPSTFKTGADYPVEETSWQDAKNFCAKLNASLPRAAQSNLNFRLPTDAEWSIAVGLPEEFGRVPQDKSNKIKDTYPWGTEWPPPDNAGNYADESYAEKHGGSGGIRGCNDGFADTSPVGSFPPNQFGLYDLAGNVWEWCEDWIDDEMNIRVVRGAAFFTASKGQILSSYRGRPPIVKNFASGFRVRLDVRSP